MKKFYTAMAVLACTVTASAINLDGATVKNFSPATAQKVEMKKLELNGQQFDLKKAVQKAKMSVRRAAEEGWEEMGLCNFDDQLLSGQMIEVEMQENTEEPILRLVQPWASFGIEGEDMYIDVTNMDCIKVPVFDSGYYVEEAKCNVWFMSYSYLLTEYGEMTDGEALEVMAENDIDPIVYYSDGIFQFPPVAMVALYPDYDEDIYIGNEDDMFIFLPGVPTLWSDVDTEATWTDGILPSLFSNVKYVETTVTVQKNNYANFPYYRIIGPWDASIDADFGGYLEFYWNVPEVAMVPYQGTGLGADKWGEVYIASPSWLYAVGEEEYEEYTSYEDWFASEDAVYNMTVEFEGDVVTVGSFQNVWINCPDSTVDSPSPTAWYTLFDPSQSDRNPSYLIFKDASAAGIGSIITDNNSEAAPVYYNIQGMQVANPQAGQIYIVRQGNKVTKQVVR